MVRKKKLHKEGELMKKAEFIERYGEEKYNEMLIKTKERVFANRKNNPGSRHLEYLKWKDNLEAYEKHKENKKIWNLNNQEKCKEYRANRRENGLTKYCTVNYELIENYELAKKDNFNYNKWHLHHRLENYWSKDTLIRKNLYYNVSPESLIWLPANEHKSDCSLSTHKPELSTWHQRILER